MPEGTKGEHSVFIFVSLLCLAAGDSAGELAGQVDRRRRLDGQRQADHSLVAEGRTQAPLHHQGPKVGDAGAACRLQGQGQARRKRRKLSVG